MNVHNLRTQQRGSELFLSRMMSRSCSALFIGKYEPSQFLINAHFSLRFACLFVELYLSV